MIGTHPSAKQIHKPTALCHQLHSASTMSSTASGIANIVAAERIVGHEGADRQPGGPRRVDQKEGPGRDGGQARPVHLTSRPYGRWTARISAWSVPPAR